MDANAAVAGEDRARGGGASATSLPPILNAVIFTFLHVDDLLSASRVCQSWFAIARDPIVFKLSAQDSEDFTPQLRIFAPEVLAGAAHSKIMLNVRCITMQGPVALLTPIFDCSHHLAQLAHFRSLSALRLELFFLSPEQHFPPKLALPAIPTLTYLEIEVRLAMAVLHKQTGLRSLRINVNLGKGDWSGSASSFSITDKEEFWGRYPSLRTVRFATSASSPFRYFPMEPDVVDLCHSIMDGGAEKTRFNHLDFELPMHCGKLLEKTSSKGVDKLRTVWVTVDTLNAAAKDLGSLEEITQKMSGLLHMKLGVFLSLEALDTWLRFPPHLCAQLQSLSLSCNSSAPPLLSKLLDCLAACPLVALRSFELTSLTSPQGPGDDALQSSLVAFIRSVPNLTAFHSNVICWKFESLSPCAAPLRSLSWPDPPRFSIPTPAPQTAQMNSSAPSSAIGLGDAAGPPTHPALLTRADSIPGSAAPVPSTLHHFPNLRCVSLNVGDQSGEFLSGASASEKARGEWILKAMLDTVNRVHRSYQPLVEAIAGGTAKRKRGPSSAPALLASLTGKTQSTAETHPRSRPSIEEFRLEWRREFGAIHEAATFTMKELRAALDAAHAAKRREATREEEEEEFDLSLPQWTRMGSNR
jgi:hypothetical protein